MNLYACLCVLFIGVLSACSGSDAVIQTSCATKSDIFETPRATETFVLSAGTSLAQYLNFTRTFTVENLQIMAQSTGVTSLTVTFYRAPLILAPSTAIQTVTLTDIPNTSTLQKWTLPLPEPLEFRGAGNADSLPPLVVAITPNGGDLTLEHGEVPPFPGVINGAGYRTYSSSTWSSRITKNISFGWLAGEGCGMWE